MRDTAEKRLVHHLMDDAGVRIGGQESHDIKVHNPAFYARIVAGGSMALGESYMDRWWDCEALDCFFERILSADIDQKVRKSLPAAWAAVKARLKNPQNRMRAFEVGRRHYDIGNELFSMMLDKRLNYSCAYCHEAQTLDEAQEAKLELTCRKLKLKPGMQILDIGCGWGGFAAYAAKHYDVEVTGVTVSREQVKLARKICDGLSVCIELLD